VKHAEKTAQDCEQVTVAERITVTLVPKAAASLASLRERTQLSKTDLVNRGISLYDFIDAEVAAGATVRIDRADGSGSEVRFL